MLCISLLWDYRYNFHLLYNGSGSMYTKPLIHLLFYCHYIHNQHWYVYSNQVFKSNKHYIISQKHINYIFLGSLKFTKRIPLHICIIVFQSISGHTKIITWAVHIYHFYNLQNYNIPIGKGEKKSAHKCYFTVCNEHFLLRTL